MTTKTFDEVKDLFMESGYQEISVDNDYWLLATL